MKSDITRFASEFEAPELFVNPLQARDLSTLRGKGATDYYNIAILGKTFRNKFENSELVFEDYQPRRTPDLDWLLDRFVDATDGIDPGRPTVQLVEEVPADVVADPALDDSEIDCRLEAFSRSTGIELPYIKPATSAQAFMWGGNIDKLQANVRLPRNGSRMKSLLHELGHGGMNLIGLVPANTTEVKESEAAVGYTREINLNAATAGLVYSFEGQSWGDIVEEAVAEGIGIRANRKLGLVPTHHSEATNKYPDIVAPYIAGSVVSGSAPAAIALELIAKEIGIPSDRYFRMFVDYANTGVANQDARQEVAETVYKGTRGQLTLGQIEMLPYPITSKARVALLWAVEHALDIPQQDRYSKIFM